MSHQGTESILEQRPGTVEQGATEWTVLVAGVRRSFFDKGKWTAHAIVPEQHRLGTYDTEEEAKRVAAEYADQVLQVLARSRALKRIVGW